MSNEMIPSVTLVVPRDLETQLPEDEPGLKVRRGDVFKARADTLVAPGNSMGIMDGGLDLAIVARFGDEVERDVHEEIMRRWHGELPVGAAVTVDLPAGCSFQRLCYAATMRTPQAVPTSLNAYLAMRGALVESTGLASRLAVPLLCCGVGDMPPERAIHQIRCAVRSVRNPTELDWYAVGDATFELGSV